MPRIAIVTDSTSDLSREAAEGAGIDIVPLGLSLDGDRLLDRIDISSSELFERLDPADIPPSTFSPAVESFEMLFRTLARTYDAVIAVLLSAKLGGSVRAAASAAETVKNVIRVAVVDSMSASLGLGFQALRARELVDRGLELDAVVERLETETRLYHLAFFVDRLDYLQHGGRIGLAASLLGGILQLKPLLLIDEGQVVPLDRSRTHAKATAELVDFARGFSRIDRLGLLYSTDIGDADALREALGNVCPRNRMLVAQFSPVLGAHVGPGAAGVCVFEGPEPF